VRIEFEGRGGFGYFPGLQRGVSIETDDLPDDEARLLEGLVERSSFFELPSHVGDPAPLGADIRHYIVKVDDGHGRQRTVRVDDPIADAALADLINELARRARAARG
jgi:hypothetical protein